jgi:hypothetical protein
MPTPEPSPSLEALYDLVPQAEEIDLREELELETQRRYWLGELRPLLGMPDLDLDLALDDQPEGRLAQQGDHEPDHDREDDTEPWHLTDRQVVGMLEHELGAERVDNLPDDDH